MLTENYIYFSFIYEVLRILIPKRRYVFNDDCLISNFNIKYGSGKDTGIMYLPQTTLNNSSRSG